MKNTVDILHKTVFLAGLVFCAFLGWLKAITFIQWGWIWVFSPLIGVEIYFFVLFILVIKAVGKEEIGR